MYNDDLLIKYMVESFDRNEPILSQKDFGPFITISRDHGCQANSLAKLLTEELAKRGFHWSILNKEIIMEAARKLDMEPQKVARISDSVDRTQMDQVLAALTTKYYKSDRVIRQTIAKVVTSAAHHGNSIIIGRGGAAITHGIQPSINIKLFAPLEWRVQSLMLRYHASREHIVKDINTIDYKRHRMLATSLKRNDNVTDLYDIQINCSTVNQKEMVAIIIAYMVEKFRL